MHLQNHFRLDALAAEALVDVHHGNLDDVGSRSLYRSIDGVALGKVANGGVVRRDVGQIAATMEERFGVAVLACQFLRLLHIGLNVGECLEISVDELLGFVAAYLQSLSQSEHRDAVYDAEVGALGFGSLVATHVFYLLLIYTCGCGGVDVVALAERFNHVLVARQMRHDAQFNL